MFNEFDQSVKKNPDPKDGVSTYYGGIDLGSRNCRLIVVKEIGDQLETVETHSRIVDLGEGVATTHRLSKRAMDRTVHALQYYKKRLESYGNIQYDCIATEACRKSSNADSFVHRISRELGMDIRIIDYQEEANYALMGCRVLIHSDARHVLLFDIGGGSTELVWAEVQSATKSIVLDSMSIPYGVVNLHELFQTDLRTHYQKTSNEVYEAARAFRKRNHVREAHRQHPVQLLGTSGTTTTVAAVKLNLRYYDRDRVDGVILTFDDAQDVIKQIQLMSQHERLTHPCIGYSKSDLILGGIAIFDGLYRAWPELDLTVTDRGVRDGVVWNLYQNRQIKA